MPSARAKRLLATFLGNIRIFRHILVLDLGTFMTELHKDAGSIHPWCIGGAGKEGTVGSSCRIIGVIWIGCKVIGRDLGMVGQGRKERQGPPVEELA